MWKETARLERNANIFREELDEFLPEKILDFHVHIFPKGVVPDTYICGGHALKSYDLDELKADLPDAYPNREVKCVCMGMPDPKYDNALNNSYLAEECDNEDFFPLRLFDPNEDIDQVRREIIDQGFIGLKPYPRFVRKANSEDIEIHDMFPSGIGEVADELGLLVVMHIPRKGRLADPVNQRQIVEVCERHPNAKFVLAHIGRAYFLKNVVGQLERLKHLPNLYFDAAMLNHWEVLEHLFAEVPHERILFATDTPIALAPGKSVEINDQYTYVTPVPWSLSISDDHGKLQFTSFLYEELRAIKKAIERLGLSKEFVRGLFFDNGWRLLSK